MNKNILSFSKDFKIQYYSCDKPIRDEIDSHLSVMEDMITFLHKKEIGFQKIKLKLKIKISCEELVVIILPVPRIIVKKIE